LSELGAFLKAIAQDRLFPAILLAFGTGLRRGELLALRWKDINLEAGLVHVRQKLARMRVDGASEGSKKTRLIFQPPKTEQSRRTIPIAPDIVETLKRHKARQAQEKLLMGQAYEDQDLVFCWANGHPLEPVGFYQRFVRLVQQAGLSHHRLHDTRHTFATLMLELGESPKTVQTMLGHASITTTLDIYSHVSLELETRAAAKLSDALRLAQQ
jgi:integrase